MSTFAFGLPDDHPFKYESRPLTSVQFSHQVASFLFRQEKKVYIARKRHLTSGTTVFVRHVVCVDGGKSAGLRVISA
jgi:hypothetical protein